MLFPSHGSHRRRVSNWSFQTFRSQRSPVQSPFKRIFNARNIREKQLPKFLQAINVEPHAMCRAEFSSFIANSLLDANDTWLSSESDEPLPPPSQFMSYGTYQRLKLSKQKLHQIAELQRVKAVIFDPDQPPDEVVLSIRHRSLTRSQLKKLRTRTDLSAPLIDVSLFVLKNRLKEGQTGLRVMVASVAYADKILSGEVERSCEDLSQYELLMFPTWASYWKLLVADLRTKHIIVYDPLQQPSDYLTFQQSLNKFVKFNYYFKRNPNYFDFSIEVAKVTPFLRSDSGIFIVKHAERVIRNLATDIDPGLVSDYKADVLDQLLLKSLKQAT